ncbi:phage major capsid protein [Secundilactobacillus yichangensis]|uniref:phage major capsid protein n=1 Tax=Secundilactobacillus yichangensis TaxID=2799580 RepID=UPI00194528DC|nr:phage major capsid protein [Secundilactobacillus yichangensis]
MTEILKGVITETRNVQSNTGLVNTRLYKELISTTQAQNSLRKLGTVITSADDQLLLAINQLSDATTFVGNNSSQPMEVNSFGGKAVKSSQVQIRVYQPFYRKMLINWGDKGLSDMVVSSLTNKIVKAEIDYMLNGVVDESNKSLLVFDDANQVTSNPNSLFNSAFDFKPTGTDNNAKMLGLLSAPNTDVLNRATFIINKAALQLASTLKFDSGEPMLKAVPTSNLSGAQYQIAGYPALVQSGMKTAADDKALFYFGNFKAFYIQDDPSLISSEILTEASGLTRNEMALSVEEFTDGRLVQSDNDPQVFKMEV